MSRKTKQVISLILAVVLLCTPLAGVKQQADAIAPVIAWVASDAVFYIVTFALGLVGVHFASKSDMAQAVNQFLIDNPPIKTYLAAVTDTSIILAGDNSKKLHLTAELYSWIATTLVPAVSNYFSRSKTEVTAPDLSYGLVNGIKINSCVSTMSAEALFALAPYSITQPYSYFTPMVYLIDASGKQYGYKFYYQLDAQAGGLSNLGSGPCLITGSVSSAKNIVCRYGFSRFIASNGLEFVNPYIVMRYINSSTGQTIYRSDFQTTINSGSAFPYWTLTQSNVSHDNLLIPYLYDIQYALSELTATMQDLISKMTGALDIPIDAPAEDVVEGKKEAENGEVSLPLSTWASIWAALGIKNLIKTLQQSTAVTESDFDVPKLPNDITGKFPFCVPFDLIGIVKALNATSVAPVFTIPVRFDGFNYNHNFVFDFSGADWLKVAMAIRWGMTILFLLGLTLLTRKLIKG